jgi:hypothetical protein
VDPARAFRFTFDAALLGALPPSCEGGYIADARKIGRIVPDKPSVESSRFVGRLTGTVRSTICAPAHISPGGAIPFSRSCHFKHFLPLQGHTERPHQLGRHFPGNAVFSPVRSKFPP